MTLSSPKPTWTPASAPGDAASLNVPSWNPAQYFLAEEVVDLLAEGVVATVAADLKKNCILRPFVVQLKESLEKDPYDPWVEKSLNTAVPDDEWENVQIVGFGEGSHGTENFFETQAAGTRYMIKYRNARCVFLEVPAPFVMLMNEYIQSGREELIFQTLKNNLYLTWSNPALYRLFCFMCKWNREHKDDPVHVVGIDPREIALVQNEPVLFAKITENKAQGALRGLVPVLKDMNSSREEIQEALAALTNFKAPSVSDFTQEVISLAERQVAFELSFRDYTSSEEGEEKLKAQWRSRKLRDELMGEIIKSKVECIKNSCSKNSQPPPRFVVLAHNFHIAATYRDRQPEDGGNPPFERLGTVLREAFPSNGYLPFLTTGYEGTVTVQGKRYSLDTPPPGSFEDILSKIHADSFFLNVKQLKEQRAGEFLRQDLSMRYQAADLPMKPPFTPGFNLGTACAGVFFHERVEGTCIPGT